MDKIILKGMIFYAHHGLKEEEKILGQRFVIDLELYLDLTPAGKSDDLSEAIDYGNVYKLLKEIVVSGKRYNLIESLAEDIAANLFYSYPLLKEAKITVKKPSVPIEGVLDYAAVEIRRKRG